MDTKTKSVLVLLVLIIGALVIYGLSTRSGVTYVDVPVPECPLAEYEAMVTNLPDEECATQWVVICGNDSTWQYQCFGGIQDQAPATVDSGVTPPTNGATREELERQLEEARQQFFDICNENPDLVVCG